MADKKISELNPLGRDTTTGVLAYEESKVTYKVTPAQTIGAKLSAFKSLIESIASENNLIKYNPAEGFSALQLATPLSISGSAITVGLATTSTAGVARFDGTYFTVISGVVSLKKIDHGALGDLSTDDHGIYVLKASSSTTNSVPKFTGTDGKTIVASGMTIDDSNNINMPAGLNVTGAIAANNIKTEVAASAIPKSGTDGTIASGWTKETVYLKVIPETSTITTGSGLIKFTIPPMLAGRRITFAGAKIYTTGGATNTIKLMKGTTQIIQLSGTGSNLSGACNTTIASTEVIQVDVTAASGSGLDVYFEVI